MKTRVTARHFDMDPKLKDYVERKVERLSRYFDRVDEAHVVFGQEGHGKVADLTVHATGVVVSSEQSGADARSAFDRAFDKVERQIRRHKEKVRSHQGVAPTAVVAEAAGGTAVEQVGIVPEELASRPMSPAEALAELDELSVRFLAFWNQETETVNVIYRRDDGDYGLIEPALPPE